VKKDHLNYVTVENIAKSYGEHLLFEKVSFSIHKDQKIAFVAKNGTGKTSILNILSGKDTADTGQIIFRNGLKTSFLSQEPTLNPELTIEETIFASDSPTLKVINNYRDSPTLKVINNYREALHHPEDIKAYQQAFDDMDRLQAWDFETLYTQILYKLNLQNLNQKVSQLSGGQKKRLALANVLINKPELLILDEPTNHLDLEMIEWLERFFAKEKMTIFMVTHDRYFLERVCNEIIELDQGKIFNYKGNYSYYLEKRNARIEIEAVETNKAKQLFKKELGWMRRQPKARTTKSKSRIDDFHDIKARAHQRRKDHVIQLELNMERLGRKIIELHNISKTFDELVITNKYNYTFQHGERIGIIGKNGTGKSTFLNMLTGLSQPDSGKIVRGETLKFGYYTQKGITIKPEQKVIEVVREYGDYIPLKKGKQISAQQLLERFLFSRKKQYDFVEKLSGGERKRLYLCTVLIQNPNFLILDEPTNDLDIVTLNVLENFLLDFPGCLIVVSHDRYFMDKIVDHLFVFKGEGIIENFPGNYSDYRAYEDSASKSSNHMKKNVKKDWKKDDHIKLSYNEQKELNNIESKLKSLEIDKVDLEAKFLDESLSMTEINELSEKIQTIIDTIENKELRWMELQEKIDSE